MSGAACVPGHNRANIWMAGRQLVIDLNTGDDVLVITQEGWHRAARASIDFDSLGAPRVSAPT